METDTTGNIDLYNESEKLTDIYPNYTELGLPRWVLDNIDSAKVYGNKKRCVILPDGRKYHLDNKLNDLTGKEWTLFINSVFTTHYPTRGPEGYAHDVRKINPSPKPPQLMKDIISFFTKEGELVFDSFAGVGGTLIGAALCGRKAAGIELNEKYIHAYEQAANEIGVDTFPIFNGNSLDVLDDLKIMNGLIGNKKISLLLIDPPYSDMMNREKTGAYGISHGSASTPFTKKDADLGNMQRGDFLEALKRSIELSYKYMKKEAYVVIFIKDLQPSKKETNLLHAEVIEKLNEIEWLYYKGMKIWADGSAKMYPYGYPFSFVANQVHQYILIFRREK